MNKTDRRLLLAIKIVYVPVVLALLYLAALRFPDISPWLLGAIAISTLFFGELVIAKLPAKIVFYIFFGVLTTVVAQLSFNAVNWLISGSFKGLGGLWWIIPQTVSWISAVLFAFATNRKFVFKGQKGNLLAEMQRFYFARLGSGVFVEYIGMLILVNFIGLPEAWSKLLTSFVVVIVNYLVSKVYVFKHSESESSGGSDK